MRKLHKDPPPGLAFNSRHSSGPSSSPNLWQRSLPTPPAAASPTTYASPATSRTMAYARSQTGADSYALQRVPTVKSVAAAHNMGTSDAAFATSLAPQTMSEQYWAVRALVAEVRLAEREENSADAFERAEREEHKRQLAVDAAHKFHEARVARLEKLVTGLISALVFIALVLLFRQHKHAEDKAAKAAFRPHLTIPILSPFTSIVEKEDSTVSFRTTAVFVIVLGILSYALIRRWLHTRQR
ncbi:hypothetical protein M0805_005753 [Coniferiporia weirii]|nr:hypothetical protein M0805_005753 [Coniferiporia weirii]